jgi:hypothetical protein
MIVLPLTDTEATTIPAPDDDSGLGALRTAHGNLPCLEGR